MSIFACRPILVFTLIAMLADIASINAQKYKSPRGNKLAKDHYERPQTPKGDHQTITLNPETLAQARRTISHLSPEARRFLFSPTIQNTITNLNQNSNTNTMQIKSEGNGVGSKPLNPERMLGYVDPESGAVEYDLRGRVKKICFILG